MITLEQALRAVPGVRAASVTIRDGAPPAVRVELMEGADERFVAEAVQEVLAEHGLRSHVAPPRVKVEPAGPPPPPEPSVARGEPAAEPSERPQPPPPRGSDTPSQPTDDARAPTVTGGPAGARGVAAVEVATEDGAAVVTVRLADGTMSRVRTRPDDAGIAEGIVHAIARLLDPGGVLPRLAGVERRLVGGVDVVTATLDVGSPRVGSAAVPGSYELGLARAVATALAR